MGAVVGAALMAGLVFLGAAGLRRAFGLGANAAAGFALLGVVVLAIGGLFIGIKLGF